MTREPIVDSSNLAIRRLYRFHLFVSYQSDDSKDSTVLTHFLQKRGLRIWLDKDSGQHAQDRRSPNDTRGERITGPATVIRSTLERAINWSMIVVVLTSPRTLASAWVRTEIQIARELKMPLFFVHLSEQGGSQRVTLRHSGRAWDGTLDSIEEVADQYKHHDLAPSFATEFMRELSGQDGVNLVGHVITDYSGIDDACHQLNQLVELSELILHKRELVSAASVRAHWPLYSNLCAQADDLNQLISDRFGRRVSVRRVPYSDAFTLKRPFVTQRVAHLKRLLEDESFRRREFRDLD